jgi:preprotein translocase subunit YajC
MNPTGLLLIVVAFAFIWLAILRPQKRRRLAQAELWQNLAVGDEIVTAGGLYGEIAGFQGDDLLVRIAPELEVRVARRAIAGVFPPDEDEPEEDEVPETEPAAEAEEPPVESYSEGRRE